MLIIFNIVSCTNDNSLSPEPGPTNPDPSSLPSCADFLSEIPGDSSYANYGAHFKQWLAENNYYDILKTTGKGGSDDGNCIPTKDPLILLLMSEYYAMEAGYSPCEYYSIHPINDALIDHRADRTYRIRRFIEAVKAYTGRNKVDIIAYSRMVTLARKSIQGGVTYQGLDQSPETACNLGTNIAGSIDTFVGIAGVNRGHLECGYWPNVYPVDNCSANAMSINNPFYLDLNGGPNTSMNPQIIADYTYSIYSDEDCVGGLSGPGCSVVDGLHTSRIPGETGFYLKNGLGDSPHFELTGTASVQFNMIQNHIIAE